MKVLVTGAAGFIGMHVAERLLARGDTVIGLDNLNDYYSTVLKEARLARLKQHAAFHFRKLDITDSAGLLKLFERERLEGVLHLAAQAGVRHSIEHPQSYVSTNLAGFMNVLEACRHFPVRHLVYASSSSVYGANTVAPFSEDHRVDHPISLYAATKRSNELMAHSYSYLFHIPTTGLRFFTVYGPWGRPDMAYWHFTQKILAGDPLPVFNAGQLKRDFTYIDDIVESVLRVLDTPARPEPVQQGPQETLEAKNRVAPYRVYNIGNEHPVRLLEFIEALENALGVKAKKQWLPMQPGDVETTHADTERLQRDFGFSPNTSLAEGLIRFTRWYEDYHRAAQTVA